MYILAWTDRINGQFTDHWQAYESKEEASADYLSLLSFEDTWTASLCKVQKSTDYEV